MSAAISPELVLVAPPDEARRLREQLPDPPSWTAPARITARPTAPAPRERFDVARPVFTAAAVVNAIAPLALLLVYAQ